MKIALLFLAFVFTHQDATSEQSIVEKIDDKKVTLIDIANILLDEGFQSGFNGISAAFSKKKHEGDSRMIFADGLVQFRLAAGSGFNRAREAISVTKTSKESVKTELNKDKYNSLSLGITDIEDIRSYLNEKASRSVIHIEFYSPDRKFMLGWYLFFVLTEEEKWRVGYVCPHAP